ncbi:hypothetical protein [Ramlibacter montanisoli]|uniref:Uncharacterized protein n=1 Tax=Ramlibacter montanisoli TaxID=2732512 RepID=A0A849KP50_9BURK|nr:hypothetical protein [Ramlibacter montanisoli]NNU43569.1 hypothetical protein [Ramlibacter montanisoli]
MKPIDEVATLRLTGVPAGLTDGTMQHINPVLIPQVSEVAMVKGYKRPKSAYSGNNPGYVPPSGGGHLRGEDDWLFGHGRQHSARPWRGESEQTRSLPKLPPQSIDDVLAYVTHNRRVCPLSIHWMAMMNPVGLISANADVWIPMAPGESEWRLLTDSNKRALLKRQILAAAAGGALQLFAQHLHRLRETEWHHES